MTSRVTEAEFLSLPESVERIELIDGEVIVSPNDVPKLFTGPN